MIEILGMMWIRLLGMIRIRWMIIKLRGTNRMIMNDYDGVIRMIMNDYG